MTLNLAKAQTTKGKLNKMDFIKMKNFVFQNTLLKI